MQTCMHVELIATVIVSLQIRSVLSIVYATGFEKTDQVVTFCFNKYPFEILKQLWFSCGTLQPSKICCISRADLDINI